MRVLVACLRGNVAERDRWGHCLCADCKAYKASHRKDRTAYHRAWRARNPERARGYSAKWVAANPEKRQAAVQSWRSRHPEKVAAMSSKAGRKWAANNKGKRNASVKSRAMAKRRAMPAWVDPAEILPFYETAARLTDETGIPHEVDHRYPLQGETACGLHVPANLQVISRFANRSKRNRMEADLCAF